MANVEHMQLDALMKTPPTDTASTERDKSRPKWDTNLEFILAAFAFTVDTTSIIKLPYMTMRHGGVCFLAIYAFLMLLLGVPLFYLEICLGQYSGKGPAHIWAFVPILRGLGFAMVAFNFLIIPTYTVILGWIVFYKTQLASSVLPWLSCSNAWNTANCRHSPLMTNTTDLSVAHDYDDFPFPAASPAVEFFNRKVLSISDSGGIGDLGSLRWELVACTLGVSVLLCLVLFFGVKVIGKVVFVTVPLRTILLGALFIRIVTLPGAALGVDYWLIPQYLKLVDPWAWVDALNLVLWTLGSGSGVIHTLASYKKFSSSIFRDSFLVVSATMVISIVMSGMVMMLMANLAMMKGVEMNNVVSSGWSVLFVEMPEALGLLTHGKLWCAVFFVCVFLLLFDTLMMSYEVLITALTDIFPRRSHVIRAIITMVVCGVIFLVCLPYLTMGGSYVIQLIDQHASLLCFYPFIILQCITVGWIYGMGQFSQDVYQMTLYRPFVVYKFFWCFPIPVLMVCLQLVTVAFYSRPFYASYQYPIWSVVIGWLVAAIPLVVIAGFAVLSFTGCMKQMPGSGTRQYQPMEYNKRQGNTSFFRRLCDIFKI